MASFFFIFFFTFSFFSPFCLFSFSEPGYSSVLGSTPTSWGWRRDGSKNHGGVISSYSPPHTRTKFSFSVCLFFVPLNHSI